MIEQKLIVGRYLELNTLPPVFAGPAAAGFQEVNRVVLHIDPSSSAPAPMPAQNPQHGFNPGLGQRMAIGIQRAGQHVQSQMARQRVSTTGVGTAAKAHRNFVWLEWLGGVVSEVQPGGYDVLTGPMSGCWIVSYTRGGVHYIGHVGTVQDHAHADSVAARAAWNAFAAANPRHSYAGFNPFNDPWVGGPVPMGLPGEAARKTFALVSAEGRFHTVIAYPQVNRPHRIRIAGIQVNRDSLPDDGQI